MARQSFVFINNNDAQDGTSLDHPPEPAGFTFVHTTGTPELSKPAAKLMRGHVTKVNFAKRRQSSNTNANSNAKTTTPQDRRRDVRKVDAAGKDAVADVAGRPTPGLRGDAQAESSSAVSRTLGSSTSGLLSHEQVVSTYLTLAYAEQDAVTHPPNETEAMWHTYFEAEPALADAAMAIAFRKWQPDPACLDWTAEMYSQRAVTQLIRRMESPGARPDNILAVVITMAFAARLAGDTALWEMHEKGVAAIVTQRCSRTKLPWLNNLILLDSMNHVFNFPRIFYVPLVHVLAQYNPELLLVLQLLEGIVEFRTVVASQRNAQASEGACVADIEERLVELRENIRALRLHENRCVQVVTRASELLLELMWPSTPRSRGETRTTELAGDIKTLIHELSFRTCIYNNLTSCIIMLGAIGAKAGSSTRTWFTDGLKRSARQLKAYGWVEPIRMLEPWLATDLLLMDEIRGLMDEVAKTSDQIEDAQVAMSATSLAK